MVASSIAKESIWEVTRVNVWFIGVLLAVLLLVTYVPVHRPGPGASLLSLSESAWTTPILVDARRRRSPPSSSTAREKLNALTRAMWQALGEAIDALSADDGVRCIIVRGAGEKAFSPGNDIARVRDRAREQGAGDRVRRASCTRRRARWPRAAIRWSRRSTASASAAGSRSPRCATCASAATSSRFGAPIKNLGLVMAYAEMAPLVAPRRPRRRARDPARRPHLRRGRSEGEGPRHARRRATRGRRRSARDGRSASPRARRSSRAGTRSSRAGSPIRGRSRRPSTTSASTASTPRTSASATRRSSRSASRSSADDERWHRLRCRIPVRSPACACSSSRRSWPGRPAA